jgi:hypothetical protein
MFNVKKIFTTFLFCSSLSQLFGMEDNLKENNDEPTVQGSNFDCNWRISKKHWFKLGNLVNECDEDKIEDRFKNFCLSDQQDNQNEIKKIIKFVDFLRKDLLDNLKNKDSLRTCLNGFVVELERWH